MKAAFLGTGTSVGIPMIGCHCPVCDSTNPRNRRRRSSLHLEHNGTHLVIDTPPDFRDQALEYRIPRVDAILFTHSHADHILGLDDIRRFNTIQNSSIPAYASGETIADLQRIFDYALLDKPDGIYRPQIDFTIIRGPFEVGGIRIEALPVEHGDKTTLGYRLDAGGRSLGYVPDCHRMPDAVIERLTGVDIMILDALRDRPHLTHLTLAESLALLDRIHARRSFVTHLCHDLEHEETSRRLPSSVQVAFDGLLVDA